MTLRDSFNYCFTVHSMQLYLLVHCSLCGEHVPLSLPHDSRERVVKCVVLECVEWFVPVSIWTCVVCERLVGVDCAVFQYASCIGIVSNSNVLFDEWCRCTVG